ncbi:MAG: UPF0149 family protein [Methyloprofundus sp.]|nr:UPF0149 family protein [Methyloprofundus sp.]
MSYSDVNLIILQKEAADSAAEVHGVASAMLCLDPKTEVGTWLAEAIAKEADLLEEDKDLLINLFEQSQELMESDEFLFDLFLPEEDLPVSQRSLALMQWCQGFLFGMGRIETSSEWPADVTEVLKDIVEFTKLDMDIEEGEEEEAEAALTEIQEYLRAAVMLIRSELNGDSSTQDETDD